VTAITKVMRHLPLSFTTNAAAVSSIDSGAGGSGEPPVSAHSVVCLLTESRW
jgi:hypothetical protein